MKYLTSSLRHGSILFAVSLSLFLFPPASFAVVGDVTLTGLPPNTAVSLTNEETKEKVEQKTDERGFVVIPMAGKSWQAGRHGVACQIDGKPVTSSIFLRDGVNRVDLTALTLSARPLDPANRQKVNEALKKSSATLKADPKNSQALLTQGSALNRLGRHGMALASLAQAAKMGSTHPALAFETGWSLMRLGMYPQAIAQLEKYEKMKPGLGYTSEFIGRSHLYMGELDKADAKLNEALKRDPNLASTTRFHQAILETLRKNPQAASSHIASLLKEAPNSPTAQIFKNATLQPAGPKPPAGAAGKDYKLSDPIRIQLPPTTAGDVAAGVAKGVVGGLLGGLFGGGRREPEGPNLVAKPTLPETTLTSKDGKTKINLSGAVEEGKPYIVMGVNQSPGNGAPHLIMLQDKNCNVMQPKEVSVYEIWEVWGGWRITVSWTKSYYENGRLVKQEKGGWSTPWHIFRAQIKDPGEIPGIWKDFGGKAFEGIRGVIASFETATGVPFSPADWNLITHATTDAGNNQLVTAPFVTGLGTDKDNNLIFKPMERTACESAPPSDPLVAFGAGGGTDQSGAASASEFYGLVTAPITNFSSTTTIIFSAPGLTHYKPRSEGLLSGGALVWDLTVQAPGANVTIELAPGMGPKDPTRIVVADYVPPPRTTIESRPEGTKVEKRPDVSDYAHTPRTMIESRVRSESRSDGTTIQTYPDGTIVETRPDGTQIRTYPNGGTVEIRPDIMIETRPDGTTIRHSFDYRVVTHPDGSRTEFELDYGQIIEIIEFSPDGTEVETRPDGTRIEKRAGTTRTVFPVGSAVVVDVDGSISFEDPPQTGQPPAKPADIPAPPSVLDFLDEAIVPS